MRLLCGSLKEVHTLLVGSRIFWNHRVPVLELVLLHVLVVLLHLLLVSILEIVSPSKAYVVFFFHDVLKLLPLVRNLLGALDEGQLGLGVVDRKEAIHSLA